MTGLRDLWADLVPDASPLADDLVSRYVATDRRAYRDQYLVVVLTALDGLVHLATDATAVRLAAWFHRAVHTEGAEPSDDAEASALLAEQTLPSYGVSDARTTEVARLVRLTGSAPAGPLDPNADVLLDAVDAVLASGNYAIHASEVRRDATDRRKAIRQRHAAALGDLSAPIFRTQLARDRYDADARANLTAELAVLEGELPAPWRGWRQAALLSTACFSAFVAAGFALQAQEYPWQAPSFGSDSATFPVVLGIVALVAVPILFRFSAKTRLVGGVALAAGIVGLILVWILAPGPSRSSGIGERVPLLITSCVLLMVAGAASLFHRGLPKPFNRGQLLAVVAAPVAIVLAVLLIAQPLTRSYLLSEGERLDGPFLPAGTDLRSALTGGVAWTSKDRGPDDLRGVVGTRHGIAVSRQAGAIEMLDPATGKLRWKYQRLDSDDHPALSATADGQLLLAKYEDVGYLLLDADTGRREAAWPRSTRDHGLQNADPLLTGQTVDKGSDKLRGVDADGNDRWTFEPGRCTSINAMATADTAVVLLRRSCGGTPYEMTGLELRNGKSRWSRPATWTGTPVVVGDLVIGIDGGRVVGVEARTGTEKWRTELPVGWACDTEVEPVADAVLLLSCSGQEDTTVVAKVNADGRLAWQAGAAVPPGGLSAVTADGRAVFLTEEDDRCLLTVASDGKSSSLPLPEPIGCRGLAAIGNQILVGTDDSVVALR